MNTADIAIIALAAVDLAAIGAGLTVALKVLPRPKVTTPRQPRQASKTPPEPPDGAR